MPSATCGAASGAGAAKTGNATPAIAAARARQARRGLKGRGMWGLPQEPFGGKLSSGIVAGCGSEDTSYIGEGGGCFGDASVCNGMHHFRKWRDVMHRI